MAVGRSPERSGQPQREQIPSPFRLLPPSLQVPVAAPCRRWTCSWSLKTCAVKPIATK